MMTLPAELRVRLGPGVLVRDGGHVLVGGHPARLMRLSPTGAALIDGWCHGGCVGGRPAAQQLARRLLNTGMLVRDPAPRTSLADVEVIVPVRDRPVELDRCLSALGLGPQVVVVDDGSADGDAIQRLALAHGARVVRRAVPGGPAAARNAGLQASTAPLVAFVDSDVVVSAGWLHRIAAQFDDPAVGAAAPRVLALDDEGSWLSRYEADHSSLDMGRRPAAVHATGPVPYVPCTALVVRREAVPVGGFDEALRVGEDVDFAWRMLAGDWTVVYDPSATVRHAHRTEPRAFVARRWEYACSIGALAQRHPQRLTPVRITPDAALALAALVRGRWPITVAVILARGARTHRTVAARSTRSGGSDGSRGSDGSGGSPALTAELTLRSYRSLTFAVARAVRRVYSPLLLLAAPRSRGARRLLLGAFALRVVSDSRPGPRQLPIAIADDLIAAAGTWVGSARARSWRPLVPRRSV